MARQSDQTTEPSADAGAREPAVVMARRAASRPDCFASACRDARRGPRPIDTFNGELLAMETALTRHRPPSAAAALALLQAAFPHVSIKLRKRACDAYAQSLF